MSGGHYDFVFLRIRELALKGRKTVPQRAALQSMMTLFADLLWDLERVDSGDCGEEEIDKSLTRVLNFADAFRQMRLWDLKMEDVQDLRKLYLSGEEIANEDERVDVDF